ncbi:putative phosphatidylinositol 5-phosphate 4-kinase type-2 alpha-like [Apostichopus japonicus]|uniref:1-phosphatidylinositol-5-phosphate 4-kinase n=2 Tax=Stichopus japonicus TaxID=307972 RepID=A0A2G8L1E5_STIJA|nr:putative phosphatidylinositol 5-phosphate 4-kinase type-2 alpha-like [Apostichopus japonicus]
MEPEKKSKKKHKGRRPKPITPKPWKANEPMQSVLMWGVNHTVTELCSLDIPVMLMQDDFKAYSKIKVDNHLYNRENLPSHFKVKEYCPMVFKTLRSRFTVAETEYRNSFTFGPPEYDNSSGKSGAKFMKTHDRRFVIKTITREEVEMMHNILPEYHKYMVEMHGKTLLPQYMGMYRLTVDGAETYVIVMRNIFGTMLPIHRKYDLKGSLIDRQASDKEKAKDLPTFKDIDFLTENNRIIIGNEAKEEVLAKLQADSEFLAELKLMDYSFLVGIHDADRHESEGQESESENDLSENDILTPDDSGADTPPDSPSTRPKHVTIGDFDPCIDVYAIKSFEKSEKREIYFMALIDILTHWGAKKKAAQAAKTVKHGAGAEISTIKPKEYAKRFTEFIGKVIE